MENKMYCFQCQETAGNVACTQVGVCGKSAKTANLQDLLIDVTKGLASVLMQARKEGIEVLCETNQMISFNLFITITNANFDDQMITEQIHKTIQVKNEYLNQIEEKNHLSESALWNGENFNDRISQIGVLSTQNEDIRSLKELITYGLKGMAAYNKHANALHTYNEEIDIFMQDMLNDYKKI